MSFRECANIGLPGARNRNDSLADGSRQEHVHPTKDHFKARSDTTPKAFADGGKSSGGPMNLLADIRYALRNTPGFAAVAIITLALGVGANTAIFTVVNAVFFNPIPVGNPERLVNIYTIEETRPAHVLPLSLPNGQDISRAIEGFSGVAMFTFGDVGVSMTIDGQPGKYVAHAVTANYFDVLGVPAAMGRTFRSDEGREGAAPVVVLSHGFWERKFAGSPGIVGHNVLLNGQGFTIVGFAPRGFQGTNALGGPDMWVTMAL